MHDELINILKVRTGIEFPAPSDCKRIVEDIFETTGKKISETTLKRFFGFATSRHKLSKYTLSALKEYAESDYTITLSTKIKSGKGKKTKTKIDFDLHDGSLKLGNGIETADLIEGQSSESADIPIEIKLTKSQVKDLVESINKFSR